MTAAGVDPTLARMQESMASAHYLALDAVLMAKTKGMRDGINASADIVAAAVNTPGMPEVFAVELANIRDAIRLLAYQLTDPAPIAEVAR